MKIQYFSETDTLAIELTSKSVASTDAITDDLILDWRINPYLELKQ
jgi:uncharacterized protein YuzE